MSLEFQEGDDEYFMNEADVSSLINSKPSTSNELENSTRKSQRTPKKKVIVEYGYIRRRRNSRAKRLKKNAASKVKKIIHQRPSKPAHVVQLTPIVKVEKEDSPQSLINHITIKNVARNLRPSFVKSKVKRTKEVRPSNNSRYDGIEHYPGVAEGARCKMEGCRLKSLYYCMKCKVHLCLKRNVNCFRKFHILSTEHKT